MERRLNVLVQAYACNPCQGSEEGVGWGWVSAIAEHHDLHVITAAYHRADIDKRLAEDPELAGRVQFHYVQHRRWHYRPTPAWKFIENSILKPIMNFAYRIWQKDAYDLAQGLSREFSFDLVHVITYVGFRFPGHYWRMPLPLVWGPIGGLENTPWRYFPALGLRGCVLLAGRNVLNTLDKLLLRGPKHAFRKAEGGVIAATSSIREQIRRWYGVDSIVRCEIGRVGETSPVDIATRASDEPLRIAWSGLHISRKALPLLLQALAMLPRQVEFHLTVLGEGPLTRSWQHIAESLGIGDRISWTGKVSRDEAVETTAKSHVMVVSSVYDLTSTVLVEALSMGLPVICPDHYGFSDAVDDSCGYKVPVSSLATIRDGIAAALRELYENEDRRRDMARNALKKSDNFRWEATGQLVSDIYEARLELHQASSR